MWQERPAHPAPPRAPRAGPPLPHGLYAPQAPPPAAARAQELRPAPPPHAHAHARQPPPPPPPLPSSLLFLLLFSLPSSPSPPFPSSSGADARVGPWRQTRGGGANAAGGISRGCRRRCFPFSPAVSAESAECVLRARNTHLLLKKSKKNLKKPFKKPKKNLQKIRVSSAGDFYFFFFLFYKITR